MVLLAYSTGWQIITPILSLYYRSFGFSVAEIGLVFSFLGLGMLVFEPIWGLLCDRVPIRKVMVPTILLSTLNVSLYAWNSSVAIFAMLEFLHGVLASAVGVAGRAMIVDLSPSRRGKAFGIWSAMYGLGAMIGPFVGGFAAQTANYRTAFYLSAFTFGIAFIFALKSIRFPIRSSLNDQSSKLNSSRSFLLAPIFAMVALNFLSLQFVKSIVPIYLRESAHFIVTETEIGLVFTAIGLVGLPTQVLVGSLSDRVGRKYPAALGMILCSFAFAAFPSISDIFQLYLVTSIYAIGGATIVPCLMATLMDISPFDRGASMGIYGAAEDLGMLVGPAVTGLAHHYYGIDAPFLICSEIMLLNAILAFIFIKRKS